MLTLSTASFIRGVKACDFNHSFYSLVNTVWLGFCVLVLPWNSTHLRNTPHCARRKKTHGAQKSLPHTSMSSLGLPFLDTILPFRLAPFVPFYPHRKSTCMHNRKFWYDCKVAAVGYIATCDMTKSLDWARQCAPHTCVCILHIVYCILMACMHECR